MSDRIEKIIDVDAPVARISRALTDHREFGSWFRVKLEGPMSRLSAGDAPADHAAIFAALGDGMRLSLLAKLSDGQSRSIA